MRKSVATACIWVLAALLASGCGSISNARKVDYRNTPTLPPLEVPPDLSALPESNLPVPQSPGPQASAQAAEQRASSPAAAAVLPAYRSVRLVREGQARYIVVQAEPSAVWESVREFLTKNGLAIASESPQAGIMETEWAENRAQVGGSKRNVLARWLASLYSTGMRDKYRVRLERGAAPGTTEIYFSHQGMEEIALDDRKDVQPGWKPRPRDAELEAEMLQRLVVHLGGERETETAVTQAAEPAPAQAQPQLPAPEPEPLNARLTRNGDGAPLLTLQDSLDRAWRRVGLSLDRMGFTVEDRDRSKGIYYVRYIDPDTQPDKKGFFARLFGSDERAPSNQFLVQVKAAENGTNVEVLDKGGDPEASKTSERILSLLYEQLK